MTQDVGRSDPKPSPLALSGQVAVDVVRTASDAIVLLDTTGRVAGWNDAARDLFGWGAEEILGQPATVLVPPERADETQRVVRALAGTGEQVALETMRLHRSGMTLDVSCRLSPVRDARGRVYGVSAIVRDNRREAALRRELERNQREAEAQIAAQRDALRALEASEQRWRMLAVHSADVAILCDEDAVIRFASPAVGRQFGYDVDAIIGADGFAFFHPEDEPRVRDQWAEAVGSPGQPIAFEVRVIDADGQWRWIEESVTSRLDVPGVEAMVVNIIDIDGRKRAETALAEVSGRDPLTGASTRERLLAGVDAALQNAHAAQRVAVAVLDLDRFKLINSTYGHEVGDGVLVGAASRLRDATFEGEIVARLGGDRFAVMLTDVAGPEALGARVRDLLTAIAGSAPVEVDEVRVTASAGAAYGPTSSPGQLLQSAEGALREAKRDMQHPVRIATGAATSTAMARAALLEDLQRALLAEEFVVQYQPVLNLSTGQIAAVEALVRWQHPVRGLLGPGAFIDAAEDSGLIVEIGQRVLRQACDAAARWAHLGSDTTPFHVAVNFSAKQLISSGAVELVRASLAAAGAQPQHLMLEVTESAVMSDVDAASATLQQLRELGVAVAVDDFGTGYSSLTYVKRFPVTALKIDRSFVSGLGSDDDDAAIVASVVSLAKAVRMDCIAEGVETDQQLRALQALGCGYAQGFLWSPALDLEAFEAWAAKHQPTAVVEVLGGATGRPEVRPHHRSRDVATPGLLARIAALQSQGASLHSVAAALNAEQILTPRGKRWHPRSVAQLIAGREQA